MNKLLAVVILAWLPALVITSDEWQDVTLEEGTEIFSCLRRIMCEARKPYEIRAMHMEFGPKGKEKTRDEACSIYRVNFIDEPAFWDSLPDILCNRSKDERREQFKEFFIRMGPFYEESCLDPTDAECVGMNKALNKLKEVITHYTVIGVCENPETTAKGGVEKAKAADGKFNNAMKSGMKQIGR